MQIPLLLSADQARDLEGRLLFAASENGVEAVNVIGVAEMPDGERYRALVVHGPTGERILDTMLTTLYTKEPEAAQNAHPRMEGAIHAAARGISDGSRRRDRLHSIRTTLLSSPMEIDDPIPPLHSEDDARKWSVFFIPSVDGPSGFAVTQVHVSGDGSRWSLYGKNLDPQAVHNRSVVFDPIEQVGFDTLEGATHASMELVDNAMETALGEIRLRSAGYARMLVERDRVGGLQRQAGDMERAR